MISLDFLNQLSRNVVSLVERSGAIVRYFLTSMTKTFSPPEAPSTENPPVRLSGRVPRTVLSKPVKPGALRNELDLLGVDRGLNGVTGCIDRENIRSDDIDGRHAVPRSNSNGREVPCPIVTVTFSYLASPNPPDSVVTMSYIPGGTCKMRKNPSSLVAIVRLNPAPIPVVVVPVAVAFALVTVKDTFGTRAPAGSLTVPSMLPVVSWPDDTTDRQRTSDHQKCHVCKTLFHLFSFTKFQQDRSDGFWISTLDTAVLGVRVQPALHP